MNLDALLTSAGINIATCVGLFSLYSVLRKQPTYFSVYFGRRLNSSSIDHDESSYMLERFVPSPNWIVKAWETTQEELLAAGGLDAVVFIRIVIFGIRIFFIATVVCTFLVLPVNYYGQDIPHRSINEEALESFTIQNVKENSKGLWTHCLALYIITICACLLLYSESKRITSIRIAHIIKSPPNPSDFAILVRSIPWNPVESYSDSVKKFFSNYHASSYLSHQMVYKSSTMKALLNNAGKMCNVFNNAPPEKRRGPNFIGRGFCGEHSNSFKILWNEDSVAREKECAAAFVFFKTRYATVAAAKALQSSNPMYWVTDSAPEPKDVYWSSLCIPYKQLWFRKIANYFAAFVFMLAFIIPTVFSQSLTQLENLQIMFPFLRGILDKKFWRQLVTGYLPSTILHMFLYTVGPIMLLLSAREGPISRGLRKKSACHKVLIFTIWNIFFINVFAGSLIEIIDVFDNLKEIPNQLAKAIPAQATYFITYVLSYGWVSLAWEVIQVCSLGLKTVMRFVLWRRKATIGDYTFPYHTEVPRVLLFGFLGFTCAILAPLIVPFLLIYFCLAYLVYKNQIMNVYVTEYNTRGKYWTMAHDTTIFSMVFSQIVALGVFGLKRSPVAMGFTIPLIAGTFLFNAFNRQRFFPSLRNIPAEVLIEMDRRDEQNGKMEEIYEQLRTAYNRQVVKSSSNDPIKPECPISNLPTVERSLQELETLDQGTIVIPSEGDISWNDNLDKVESVEK